MTQIDIRRWAELQRDEPAYEPLCTAIIAALDERDAANAERAQVIAAFNTHSTNLTQSNMRLRGEREALRTALEWYGDANNYRDQGYWWSTTGLRNDEVWQPHVPVTADQGARANAALAAHPAPPTHVEEQAQAAAYRAVSEVILDRPVFYEPDLQTRYVVREGFVRFGDEREMGWIVECDVLTWERSQAWFPEDNEFRDKAAAIAYALDAAQPATSEAGEEASNNG